MPGTYINARNFDLNAGYTPRFQVELVGNWAKVTNLFGKLSPKIKQASVKAQIKVCTEIARRVKAHLRNQDLNWKSLNPYYASRKAKAGLGSKILMNYRTYYDNITVWQKGNQHLVLAGVKRGVYTKTLSGKRSAMEVASIATVHEFASGKGAARRPLWNPTIQELGGSKGIKAIYLRAFIWHLRRSGVPVTPLKGMI